MENSFLSLHCCLGLDPEITNPNIFRHFLDFYKKNGVERFSFIFNLAEENEALVRKFIKIVEQRNVSYQVQLWIGMFCSYVKTAYQNHFILNDISPNGWGLLCDLDEFHVFDPQKTLRDFLLSISTSHYDSIRTKFQDQTTESGELVAIKYPKNIYEQFPRASNLTTILQRHDIDGQTIEPYTRKIAAVRRGIKVTSGHHNTIELSNTYPNVLITHHFKWDSLLIKRLQKRIAIYDRDSEKYFWTGEFHAALNTLSNGLIPPNLLEQAAII